MKRYQLLTIGLLACSHAFAAQQAPPEPPIDTDEELAADELAVDDLAVDDGAADNAGASPLDLIPTDMNLTGEEIGVSVIGGSLVITGNGHDVGQLQQLIQRLDQDMPAKALQVVKLEKRSASELAATVNTAVNEIIGVAATRPENRVTVTAVSSNVLLVVAPSTRMEMIVSTIRAIDAAAPELKFEMMVFPLANRKPSEAANRLKQILTKLQEQQGAAPSEEILVEPNDASNTLMVFGPVTMRDRIGSLLEQIDADVVPGNQSELKLVVFPLLNAEAEAMAGMFKTMIEAAEPKENAEELIRRLILMKRPPGQPVVELPPLNLEKNLEVIADKGTNSLIVATVDENIVPMGEIIALLDSVPMSVDMGLRIYPLEFADAQSVSDALDDMFQQGKDLPKPAPGSESSKAVPPTLEGEALVYNLAIVPDIRTNTVLIAGRPVQLTLADRIVAELDQPATALKHPLRLMFLGENLDATRVGQIVDELFTKRIEALEAQKAGPAAIERERVFQAVDIRSNALILSATEENITEIRRIVDELNVAPDRLIDNIRIITCVNTSAADLQSKIDELWKRKAELRREGEALEDLPVVVADQRSNSLVIASSPEDFDEIKRLIDRLESQPLAPMAQIRMIQLANNDASEISNMLKDLFEERMKQRLAQGQEENPSDRVALAFDAPTNTVLVASTKENFDEMSRIVAELDLETNLEGIIQTFVLQNAEATAIAEKIKELFDQGLYTPSTGIDSQLAEERMKVAIVADSRANAIVVSASRPNLSIVERLVKQMDDPNTPMQDNTRLFGLEFADAVKLTDMLERLFEGMKANAPDPDIFTEPTIIPDDRSNTLIVSGSRDALTRCEELIEKLDAPTGPPTSKFEIYGLEFASAVKMAPIMQDMFDKRTEGATSDQKTPINLFADEGSNTLIVSASRDDQVVVQSLLGLLDKPSTIAGQFQIFPLRKAKAAYLQERLDELFKSRAESAGGDARADATAVQADERTNSLIVWGSPTEMENIGAIISRLDSAEPQIDLGIRMIQLKQARAEDLANVLQESLIGESGQGEDSQAVIVSYTVKLEDGTRETRRLVRQDVTITPDERTNTVTVMAPAESMDMLEALIVDFDSIGPMVAEIRLFPLANADAEEIVERLEALFDAQSGDGIEQTLSIGGEGGAGGGGSVRQQLRFAADRRTNTIIAAGAEKDLGMVEKLIYQLDAQGAEDRVVLVYEARHTTAEAITNAIRDFSQAEQDRFNEIEDTASASRRAERQVTAIGDEQSNSVVLGMSPRYADQFMTLIHELDRPPPQVMIQVLIAEVTLDDRVELGLEFAGQDLLFTENAVAGPNGTVKGADFDIVGGTDVGAGTGSLGGFNFTITGEDFSFLLRALESDSRLEVLSRPIIMVENNEEANITIGDSVPIASGSSFTDGGNTNTQINYQDVGIILDVTPHINPDGYVNLEIHPEISQVSDSSIQLTEGLSAPIISQRSATTVITVKDGETIVIGGLITESETQSDAKVPILGDIPGLGMLFRRTNDQVRKTELLMVLTVNVLRTDEDIRTMSIKQRDKTGLLENVSRNPLMESLRIRPEEDMLAPGNGKQDGKQIPVRPNDREIYGPTPNIYGPPSPSRTRVDGGNDVGIPVAVTRTSGLPMYGPPMPFQPSGPQTTGPSTADLAPLRIDAAQFQQAAAKYRPEHVYDERKRGSTPRLASGRPESP